MSAGERVHGIPGSEPGPIAPDAEAMFVAHKDAPARLAALRERAILEMSRLDYPNFDWVPETRHPGGEPVSDVVIVGAGQGGLGVGLALWRERVRNIRIIDQAPAGEEGPWVTFARMRTLRTPKYLTGPDTGIPGLTFPAWFEAVYAEPTWDRLSRIPRQMWMAYLKWFRSAVDLPVGNEIRLCTVEPEATGLLRLQVETTGVVQELLCRKLVLANGLEGSGSWYLPPDLIAELPGSCYSHSAEAIDFAALAGKRVAVLGIGASAADNAACALEAGAHSVDIFFRRDRPPFGERRRWVEHNGFLRHFADLPDETRWRAMGAYFAAGTPAPRWSLDRIEQHSNARFHPGEAWLTTAPTSGGLAVVTAKGRYGFDFAIFATGIVVDLDRRPELSAFRGKIATWGDRFTPPKGEENGAMARYPYLSAGGALQEKRPGAAPHLRNIHVFNWGATMSLGISSSSITGMKFGLARIVSGITRDLYFDQAEAHIDAFPTRKR